MILISGLKLKDLNQNNYDKAIRNIKPNLKDFIISSFEQDNSVIFNGTYIRYFVSSVLPCKFHLKIQRILCLPSGKTHALIPSCLVPYSIIPLEIQTEIIQADDSDIPDICNRYYLDNRTILRIRKQFHSYWFCSADWFSTSFDMLVEKAIRIAHKQFMQSRGCAFLYSPT